MTTSPAVRLFDPVDYLALPATMANHLEGALDEGDPQLAAAVLGDIARAKGMSEVAQATGLGRELLYKTLSRPGRTSRLRVLLHQVHGVQCAVEIDRDCHGNHDL